MNLFKQTLNSTSYSVAGAALNGIIQLDPALGMTYAKRFENDNEGQLTQAIIRVYADQGGEDQWSFVYNRYKEANFQDQVHLTREFAGMIGRLTRQADILQGV